MDDFSVQKGRVIPVTPGDRHINTVIDRVLRGFGANIYSQLVTVVVQLVGVPILLHTWGPQLYGEWLILFAIPACLSLTDLGFSISAANDMTARVARGDRVGALSVFQSLAMLVYGIGIGGVVLSAAAIFRARPDEWINFEAMDADTARWTLWLLAAQVFVALPDGVNHAGFRANGDYAVHAGLSATTRLLQFGGIWVVALAGGGPVIASTIFFGVRALATLVCAFLLVRRHRWLSFGFVNAKWTELRRLMRPALANMAIPAAQVLNIQGMVLVVGAVLGPLAVVVFSTLRTLTRLVLQLILAVTHAAEPELAVAYGAGDRALMRALFVHALRGGFWLAVVAAMGLALFGGLIVEVWTGGEVTIHPMLFAWLLGSAVATVLWYVALTVLRAANKHLLLAATYMLSSALVVALAALLLGWTKDLAYAGISLLIMDVAMTLFAISSVARLLREPPFSTLARAANPLPLLDLGRASLLR